MAKERFIRSFDGTEIFTSVSGAGPAIILCDGLGCDGFIWKYLQPRLEEHYTVVRWHYRGHGLSQLPESIDAMSISDFSNDLAIVLDALEIEKAALVGHSMGVQVILEFALRHAHRVTGLAAMCGSYGAPLSTFHNTDYLGRVLPLIQGLVGRNSRRAQWLWTKFLNSEFAFQGAWRVEVNPRLVRRKDFTPYFDHLASMDISAFMSTLEHTNAHSVEHELQDIKTPTLIVAGEHDGFTPAWISERMSENIPDAEYLLVPGGTHVAPIEIPELVALRLEKFLKQRVYGTAAGATKKKAVKKKAAKKKRVSKRRARTGGANSDTPTSESAVSATPKAMKASTKVASPAS